MMSKGGLKPFQQVGQAGYVYADQRGDTRFYSGVAGDIIANETGAPPWIVVSKTLVDVLVSGRWPGALWQVEIITPIVQQEHRGRYTRCSSVRLVGKVPLSALFEPVGDTVVAIADRILTLSRSDAALLKATRRADAAKLYDRIWKHWLAAKKELVDAGDNYDGVLQAGNKSPYSPIGYGLSLIHSEVYDRAKALEGDAAIGVDEEEDASYLLEPWATASSALADAALAAGSDAFITLAEKQVMTAAWHALCERDTKA